MNEYVCMCKPHINAKLNFLPVTHKAGTSRYTRNIINKCLLLYLFNDSSATVNVVQNIYKHSQSKQTHM
jgi:hypothetical protein